MKHKIDTSAIDDIIVGRIYPSIYAFSTTAVVDALKVGDTYRTVSKRLNEWNKHYPNIKKVFEHSAKLDDGRIFRDYEVHKYLVNEKKLNQLNHTDIKGEYYSREFFRNATKEDIIEAIADIKRSAKTNDEKYKFYTSERLPEKLSYQRGTINYPIRANQENTVKRFSNAIAKGHKNLLMYAVMRFGKSFTAMCCALDKELNAKTVVIVSAKADVEAEWQYTIETHEKFIDFDFINKNSLEQNNHIIFEKLSKGRKIVIFLTLQDLSGTELKKRHTEIFSKEIDLLIIDETHFGARAPEYGKVLHQLGLKQDEIKSELEELEDEIVYNHEKIKEIKAKVSLHLSGTPYRILMGEEFKEDQIIAFYQYIDIVNSQKEWDKANLHKDDIKEWENPYFGFPQMIRFGFNPNSSCRKKIQEIKKSGKSNALSHLFRTLSLKKVKDNSHKLFKYEKEILELFQVIDGVKTDDGLLSFLNYNKIIEGKLCRHIVCVLPFKSSCDALEKLIYDYGDSFLHLKEYEIINISGVDNEKLYPSISTVKHKIKSLENQNKKTITLTVNRMLTGTTVAEWDTMFYFKDSASPQEYDQSIFRLQNQYIKIYEEYSNKEITKVNMKPQTLLVDFDIDRLFHMQVQKSLFYNINVDKKGNEALEERINKELEISPIICLNKDKLVQITPTNIINAARNYSQNRSIFDEADDVPFDKSLMENNYFKQLITSIQPIDAKKGLEILPAEGFGNELELESNNPKPQPSPLGMISENNYHVNEDDSKIIEKKLAAYRLRILFFAFLSKSKVDSLKKIIESVSEYENSRILKNVGLNLNDLMLMEKDSSPFILNRFEWKIKNINELGHDLSLTPIDRALRAMKKFERVSDSEVIMPSNVAEDLINLIPENKISSKSIILDLSSKQGELTIALFKRFHKSQPNLLQNVYSITTSPLAFELTSKVYESLNLPLKNVLAFNSFDIISARNEKYKKILSDLKPTIILAGPPFNKKDGGGRSDSGSGSAIYHQYFNLAKELNPSIIAMVLKASWYSGGKGGGLVDFRKSVMEDKRMTILHDYPNPTKYFESSVSLRGGICTFLWKDDHNDDCQVYNHIDDLVFENIRPLKFKHYNILIRYNIGVNILNKVISLNENTILNGAYPRNTFNLPSNLKEIKSKYQDEYFKVYLAKSKFGYISIQDLNKYIFKSNNKDASEIKFIKSQKNYDLINKWKVLVAKASPGTDEFPHLIISEPIISEPGSLCTDTHLIVRVLNSRDEAENLKIYMKTKFFRFMMLLAKNNHNMNKEVFQFVPIQSLKKSWTDNELFSKYKFTDDEINFINILIKDRG